VEAFEPVDDGGAKVMASLRVALKDAMSDRDAVAASAVRSALSAIGNAEAVSDGSLGSDGTLASGGSLRSGGSESSGLSDQASRLRREADVLTSVLSGLDQDD
jgi:uncharacterized protein